MGTKAKWFYLALGAAGALALVAGTAVAGLTAHAAIPSGVVQATPMPGGAFGRGDGRGLGGDDGAALAAALGISQDELDTAYQKAWEAALADAVEAGTLTQDQADEMRDRGLPGRRGARGLMGADLESDTYLAEALGISVDALHQAQTEALTTRLNQAVADGSITQDQAELMLAQHTVRSYLQEAMTSAYSEAVAQALADGAITQAQADLLLSQPGVAIGVPGFGGWLAH